MSQAIQQQIDNLSLEISECETFVARVNSSDLRDAIMNVLNASLKQRQTLSAQLPEVII